MKSILSKRKQVKKGKRFVIRGQITLSAFEIHQGVAKSERQTLRAHKCRETKMGKSPSPNPVSDNDSDRSGNESRSEDELEMHDCIEVHQI